MFDELVAALADGSLQPLPVQSFAAVAVADRHALMAQARHIGKIVLLPDAIAAAPAAGQRRRELPDHRRTRRARARHCPLAGRRVARGISC